MFLSRHAYAFRQTSKRLGNRLPGIGIEKQDPYVEIQKKCCEQEFEAVHAGFALWGPNNILPITGTQFSCPHFFGYVVQIGQSVRLENRALLVKSVFSSLMWPPYYRRSPSIIVCFLCDLRSFGCLLATSSSRKHLVSRFWLFKTAVWRT